MRTTREAATAERPWTSGRGRPAVALALVAVSVLAWPVKAWGYPGGDAGGNGPLTTGPTPSAAARPVTRTAVPASTTRALPRTPAASTGAVPHSAASLAVPAAGTTTTAPFAGAVRVPPGERVIDGQQVSSIGAQWDGGSPNTSTGQLVPFALGALVLIFVFVQWLIDRRDPKFVEAPARKYEDSIGFE